MIIVIIIKILDNIEIIITIDSVDKDRIITNVIRSTIIIIVQPISRCQTQAILFCLPPEASTNPNGNDSTQMTNTLTNMGTNNHIK